MIDIEKLKKEVVVEFHRAKGPGGQRKNKKETAVRLTHLPTGLVAVATERRSQAANFALALRRLGAKLEELNQPKTPRIPTKTPAGVRKAQLETKKRQATKKARRQKPKVEELE